MQNKIQSSHVVPYTNSGEAAVKGGELVKVGGIFGVAVADIPVGGTGILDCEGVYALPNSPKSSRTQGDQYKSGADFVGTVFEAASGSAPTVKVLLNFGLQAGK